MLLASAGSAVAPVAAFYAQAARADCRVTKRVPGFGPLAPALPKNPDNLRFTGPGDLSKTPLISLPSGFSYTAVSVTGQPMSDGQLVPGRHDGMGCFQPRVADGYERQYTLVRNHELQDNDKQFGNRAGVVVPSRRKWDTAINAGGTTTLILDEQSNVLRDYASLGGTVRNCAGGITPWNTWLSCEEAVDTPKTDRRFSKKHGYVFEVSPSKQWEARPLTSMGRFNHEAVAVDPQSGDIYLTEDRGDSVIYKYTPTKANPQSRLEDSGTLFALCILPEQRATCNDAALVLGKNERSKSVDTSTAMQPFLGQKLRTKWVALENVDPDDDVLRVQAHDKGAATFVRGEGMWFDQGRIYWCATSGGDSELGQIFEFDIASQTLRLVVESTIPGQLEHPDNITVGPDGTLYVSEDGPGENGVKGIDTNGNLFPFVMNVLNESEMAGACFSPDGTRMFVNMQIPGITLCIFKDSDQPLRLAG